MPIKTYKAPSSSQLIYRIIPENDDPGTYDHQILAGLTEALDPIEQSAKAGKSDRQTYVLAPPLKKRPFGLGKPLGHWTPPDEFDPWSEETIDFWRRVGRNPELHAPATSWLRRVLFMLQYLDNYPMIDGMWEYDDTQFPEPAISTLATENADFVPLYTKFLAAWDMDHEVWQHDTIVKIIENHGITEQTESLIILRTGGAMGQRGFDTIEEVLPLLMQHYGDLAGTDFLKRLVAYHHAGAVGGYGSALSGGYYKYQRGLLEYPNMEPPKVSKRIDTWFLGEFPEIAGPAMPLFEELERKRQAEE